MEKSQKVFVAIGTVAVVGLAVFGGKVLFSGDSVAKTNTSSLQAPAMSSSSTSQPSASTTTATTSGNYKDGEYTVNQSYFVPHGDTNSIAVTLTIANGKISAVKTSDHYVDGESSMYINGFENSVSSDANGQSLDSYSPSRIGGASLTTEAFVQALDTIKSQAAV